MPSRELDPLIDQYEHESHRQRANEALHILRKIASMVKPIMRRRNWRVGTLAEFYPSETVLLGLNINRGEKINLRLRHAGDVNQFLPIEQVADTMLHELCHIEIGPHNAQFNALWDQLRDEHEALIRKGYTGEGFLGHGDRVGGQRIPLHEAKRRARAAAEKRRTVAAGSGQRLGGSGIVRGQDARSVIAAAVERRSRIQRGCASGTETGKQVAQNEEVKKEKVTTTQAEREDQDEATMVQALLDLIEEEESAAFGTGYVRPSAENPAGPRSDPEASRRARELVQEQVRTERELSRQRDASSIAGGTTGNPNSNPFHSLLGTERTSTPTSQIPAHQSTNPFEALIAPSDVSISSSSYPETWTCEVCTLVNPIDFLTCNACAVERPAHYGLAPGADTDHAPKIAPLTKSRTRAAPGQPRNGKDGVKETPNALKPRMTSGQAYARFEQERREKVAATPVGWRCTSCGNFMEQEWWTCSVCGSMKSSS